MSVVRTGTGSRIPNCVRTVASKLGSAKTTGTPDDRGFVVVHIDPAGDERVDIGSIGRADRHVETGVRMYSWSPEAKSAFKTSGAMLESGLLPRCTYVSWDKPASDETSTTWLLSSAR